MKTRRKIDAVRIILLTLASVFAFSARIHAQTGEVYALRRANEFFGVDKISWNSKIIGPIAKAKAIRRLERLSRSLFDLANEKQKLSEDLSANNGRVDSEKAKASIENFKDIVEQVRHDIEDFSSILPQEQKQKGMDAARELFDGLAVKWDTLNRVENLIGGGSGNSEEAKTELRAAVKQVQELQIKVDGLAAYFKTQ